MRLAPFSYSQGAAQIPISGTKVPSGLCTVPRLIFGETSPVVLPGFMPFWANESAQENEVCTGSHTKKQTGPLCPPSSSATCRVLFLAVSASRLGSLAAGSWPRGATAWDYIGSGCAAGHAAQPHPIRAPNVSAHRVGGPGPQKRPFAPLRGRPGQAQVPAIGARSTLPQSSV
jgi:hypothetical protein